MSICMYPPNIFIAVSCAMWDPKWMAIGHFLDRRNTLLDVVVNTHNCRISGAELIPGWANSVTLLACNSTVLLYYRIHSGPIFCRRAQRHRSCDLLIHRPTVCIFIGVIRVPGCAGMVMAFKNSVYVEQSSDQTLPLVWSRRSAAICWQHNHQPSISWGLART